MYVRDRKREEETYRHVSVQIEIQTKMSRRQINSVLQQKKWPMKEARDH